MPLGTADSAVQGVLGRGLEGRSLTDPHRADSVGAGYGGCLRCRRVQGCRHSAAGYSGFGGPGGPGARLGGSVSDRPLQRIRRQCRLTDGGAPVPLTVPLGTADSAVQGDPGARSGGSVSDRPTPGPTVPPGTADACAPGPTVPLGTADSAVQGAWCARLEGRSLTDPYRGRQECGRSREILGRGVVLRDRPGAWRCRWVQRMPALRSRQECRRSREVLGRGLEGRSVTDPYRGRQECRRSREILGRGVVLRARPGAWRCRWVQRMPALRSRQECRRSKGCAYGMGARSRAG